jgi:isoquinoline 1-oxidoreductase beta subunit
MSQDRVTVYPTQVGGGFGHKIANEAACEAAILARQVKRPVQLMWSRAEEMQHGRHRPPAKARMTARLGAQGRIAAWRATIAAPADMASVASLLGLPLAGEHTHAAAEGAVPPYAIPALTIHQASAEIGVATGLWRAGAHGHNAFFTESFIDELAVAAKQDALTFRMAMLGAAPRLARCLSQAASAGGWSGEAQSGQGLAAHSAFGSHAALYAEAGEEDGAIKVSRLVAVVDCGRVINPDIVRQQVESGLVWGMAEALGGKISYARGLAEQTALDALHLPKMADMPEIEIHIVASNEAPGGVAELAVPVTAPAIANAIFSATGKRLRRLPLL